MFVVTDLVPAVAIFSAVKLEEDAAVDVLRARRVLERAVVHEAMRTATAADISELQRTIDLLERHLGERPSVMRADAMFHRALVRACRNETIQAAMRGGRRGLAPIRDAYSGGVAYDRQTLDVHRRQLHAMERRDDAALEEVLDEHFRMLETQFAKGIGRRWSDLFGPRARRGDAASGGRDERGHGARLGLEDRSRRRRGPRRRPGAAAARRSGPRPAPRRGARSSPPRPRPAKQLERRAAGRHGRGRPTARRRRSRGRTTPPRETRMPTRPA